VIAITRTTSHSPSLVAMVDAFLTSLRRAGLPVTVWSASSFAEAVLVLASPVLSGRDDRPVDLGSVGESVADHWYWAARCTLLSAPEQFPVFDAVWAAFWSAPARGAGPQPVGTAQDPADSVTDDHRHSPDDSWEHGDPVPHGGRAPIPPSDRHDHPGNTSDAGLDECLDDPPDDAPGIRHFSAGETLRTKDFARMSAAEHDEAHRVMAGMRLVTAHRPARRRHRLGSHGHRALDLRATVRAALATDGELLSLSHNRRRRRPRRVVMLVDISGSMEAYARSLLRFVQATVSGAAVRSGPAVEAFSFGTRLTRLTRELALRDPDAAMKKAAEAVADWSGGTRLGESLRAFNDLWGTRGIARGAVVVIVSDGWDRGAPAVLEEQMARLGRVAHRVIWVNPLKATPGYEPLAAGMAAALPHVDAFVEGHDLRSLECLAEEVGHAAAGNRSRASTRIGLWA